jgi:hypothetical protein
MIFLDIHCPCRFSASPALVGQNVPAPRFRLRKSPPFLRLLVCRCFAIFGGLYSKVLFIPFLLSREENFYEEKSFESLYCGGLCCSDNCYVAAAAVGQRSFGHCY